MCGRRRSGALSGATLLFLCACGRVGFVASPSGSSDSGTASDGGISRADSGNVPDAGAPLDASPDDAGGSRSDAGGPREDGGGVPDAAPPDPPDAGGPAEDAGAAMCPPGSIYAFTDHAYCIEELQSAPLPYYDAADTCAARGWGLCSGSEYDTACPLGLRYVLDSWEWIKDMVSATEAEKRVPTACGDTSIHPIADPYPFRCCMNL